MKVKQIIIAVIFCLLNFSLFSQTGKDYKLFEHNDFIFPYELNSPDKLWQLPAKLLEISGLSYIDENRLACVQDEKGNIYVFNLKTGEVERKIDFAGDGDYEGIEILGADAWILKSNGDLFLVEDFMKFDETTAKKYSTPLTKKNDAEGLACDPHSDQLLIACKGHPFVDEKSGKEFKAIYSFSIKTRELNLNPFLLIEMDTIKYYKNYNTMTQLGVDLLAYFDHAKGDESFQPSGIAIHPLSGNTYVIGSVGNLLMVFSREGQMLAMVKLRSKIHAQPEGICFDPDGTLYISNEGDGEEATILRFEPK
jgi:uncharacterized protein YjiK